MTFSPTYVAARARFREAVNGLGWASSAYPIGHAGPGGEDLTIDVAMSPGTAERVVVISSGIHGVEGFLGSAVQIALLERWKHRADQPPGLRWVLIHALNPYGFAWSRRFDADNIDLNRNFLLEGADYRGSAAVYARLDGFLNPRRPPSRWDLFYLKAILTLARHGTAAVKDTIVAGQHDFPKGLFFGGARPSRTQQILDEHMKSWIGDPNTVLHFDFHSGLGAWGTYKLLVDYRPNAEQQARLTRCFGPGGFEEMDLEGVAYPPRGSLGRWCLSRKFAPEYLVVFAEFGTYGGVRVFGGLRAENQAHHWARAGDHVTVRAKERLRELFCPASPTWRSGVLASGAALVEQAASRL